MLIDFTYILFLLILLICSSKGSCLSTDTPSNSSLHLAEPLFVLPLPLSCFDSGKLFSGLHLADNFWLPYVQTEDLKSHFLVIANFKEDYNLCYINKKSDEVYHVV